jgi:putative peptidoglycan lipid II flippase
VAEAEEPGSKSKPVSDEPNRPADEINDGYGPPSVLRGAAKSAVLLTIAGLAGQVFTLARELFVAAKVGVSGDLDALLVAAVAPVMFASLLASGTSAAIVPGYLAAMRESGRIAADRLLGATLTWTVLIGIALSAIVVAGAGLVVAITGPGLDESARSVAIGYVPLLSPMLVFSATGGLLAASFQIHDRMRAIALAWIAGPVASVIVTVLLWDRLGLTAYAIAMTVQQAVIVFVLIGIAMRFHILVPITLRADRAVSARFIRHATPLTISASALQFNLLTDRAVATLITPGAVSALRYAEGVIRIPMNAIGPAWSAAIYPALVRASLLGESRSLGQAAASAMRYVTAIFVPIAVAIGALAPVIVEVAYERGAFDERASVLTAASLAGFAPLMFLTMANSILTGAHNARQRGVFLMSMGFLDAILNAAFNVGLGLTIGVAGIALSTSLTMGVIQFIKAWRLGSLEEAFPLAELLLVSARSLVASLLVAVPISLIAWNLPHGLVLQAALALLVGLATAGMVGYVALGRLIGLDEPWIVARTLLRSPLRFRPGAR